MGLLLDRTARRYSTRPSTLLGLGDDAEAALDLDLALAYYAESREDDPPEAPTPDEAAGIMDWMKE